jgi:hypothetical protein
MPASWPHLWQQACHRDAQECRSCQERTRWLFAAGPVRTESSMPHQAAAQARLISRHSSYMCGC